MLAPEFEISTDPDRINIELVHDFLSKSYWAHGRSRTTVEQCIRNSLCFGVYRSMEQVAFARVITDRAVFGYLVDVFVIPAFRGRGISKALMQAIVSHPELQGLSVMLLRTRDAQGLYAQFGFDALPRPDEVMARYATM